MAEPLYVLADTAVIGHIGTPQLSGFAVATGILVSAFAVFIFLAYGTTASVGRLLGAGNEREAARQAVQGLWLAAVAGVVVALALWPLGPWLIARFTDDAQVRTNAAVYLNISLPGIPAVLLTLAGVGYLRGLQDTTKPLMVALATALFNLLFESVLIYGFDQGLGASALSTVIAQWLAAAAYLRWTYVAVRRVGVGIAPIASAIARLARVGGHLFIRTLALRGSFVAGTAVAGRMGTVDVAAHQIAFNLWMLLALILDAVAIAGQSIVARLLGAGDRANAIAAGRRMVQWSIRVGVLLGVLLLALRPILPPLFTEDHAVRDLTRVPSPAPGVAAAPQRRRVRARRHPHRRRRPAVSGVGHDGCRSGVRPALDRRRCAKRWHRLAVGRHAHLHSSALYRDAPPISQQRLGRSRGQSVLSRFLQPVSSSWWSKPGWRHRLC